MLWRDACLIEANRIVSESRELSNEKRSHIKGDVMNRKNTTNYEKLARVVEFGKRTVSLFPKDSAAGEILEALDSNVRELSEKTAAHVVAERAMQVSLTARAAARENLRLSIAQ